MKANIWFLMPSTNVPTGGINNCYRLCQIADELGIKARVLSEYPYEYCDPTNLIKYWVEIPNVGFRYDKYNVNHIQEGDIVVLPEIYGWRPQFDVPVRRVTYIQNWALMSEHSWENHYWTYNNWTHLSYCIESAHYEGYTHRTRLPGDRPVDWPDTAMMVGKKKLKWTSLTPYFDFENYSTGYNDPNKILMLPRKMGNTMDIFKNEFGDKLVIVDNVTPKELRDIYREVGTLIIPSPAEGLSFPMIEALLSGCCVVSWECGAPEEYLIHGVTSMLAEFGDIHGLINHTKYLINNPIEMKKMSEKGRNLVTELYTKEKTKTEMYIAYYASLKIKPEL